MSVEIRKVSSKRDLKHFIRFNYELYKGNPYSVPDLYEDMLSTFSPKKNAAFDFCEAEYFMAYKDGKLVGRVAAIVNHRANETWKKEEVRFGWIDFIDDREVSQALLQAVEDWGRKKGMTTIAGPLGFTDLDAEGMLIEGFDQLSTISTIYNYPYYPEHMEALGYHKETDWIEKKIYVPKEVPEKFARVAKIISEKSGLHVRKISSKKELRKSGQAYEIFHLVNEAYAPLFGFSKMSERQIDAYVRMYIPLIDLRMITLIENDKNEMIGVGISMASLSRAMQKAKGKLLPFGWFHLLKALFLRHDKMLDLLLVAIKPEYQNKGANALLFNDLIPIYNKMGFEWAETNPELESNEKVQSQWQYLESEQHKRRRCYSKPIETIK